MQTIKKRDRCKIVFIYYSSCAEAAKTINSRSSDISRVCRKERKTTYGYIWLFYEDYINKNYDIRTLSKHSKCKSVICLDTGKIYPSMHKAYLDTGCNDKCIKKCCEGEYKAIKSKDGTGLRWAYYNEE